MACCWHKRPRIRGDTAGDASLLDVNKTQIPSVLWRKIFGYLDGHGLHLTNCVCKAWRHPNDPLWRELWVRNFGALPDVEPCSWRSSWKRELLRRVSCGLAPGTVSPFFLKNVRVALPSVPDWSNKGEPTSEELCRSIHIVHHQQDLQQQQQEEAVDTSPHTLTATVKPVEEVGIRIAGIATAPPAAITTITTAATAGDLSRVALNAAHVTIRSIIGLPRDAQNVAAIDFKLQCMRFLSPKGYFDVEMLASCLLRAAFISLHALGMQTLPALLPDLRLAAHSSRDNVIFLAWCE